MQHLKFGVFKICFICSTLVYGVIFIIMTSVTNGGANSKVLSSAVNIYSPLLKTSYQLISMFIPNYTKGGKFGLSIQSKESHFSYLHLLAL